MEGRKRVTVYLVRQYCRTTEKHWLGAGLESFSYIGKCGHVLSKRGSYVDAHPYDKPNNPFPFDLKEYGFKRLADAKRYAERCKEWCATHPNDDFTDYTFVIVAEGYWS